MTDNRPWYKITFSGIMPGTALCTNWPKRGHHRVGGRWIVFDKAADRDANSPLFDAETPEECNEWIDQRSHEWRLTGRWFQPAN